jgi:beta-xylosidase
MRYGRSTGVTGPYVDKTGRSLATGGGTLLSDGTGSPGGHNGIFQENGNYYIVYHLYTTSGSNLQIRRLYFDAQNWPTLDSSQGVAIRPLQRTPAWGGNFASTPFDPLGRRIPEPRSAGRIILLGND